MILLDLERLFISVRPPNRITSLTLGKTTALLLMTELHANTMPRAYRGVPVGVCTCHSAIHFTTLLPMSDETRGLAERRRVQPRDLPDDRAGHPQRSADPRARVRPSESDGQ